MWFDFIGLDVKLDKTDEDCFFDSDMLKLGLLWAWSFRILVKLPNCLLMVGPWNEINKASLTANSYRCWALAIIVVFSVRWALVSLSWCSWRKWSWILPVWVWEISLLSNVVWVIPMYDSALLCRRGHSKLYTKLVWSRGEDLDVRLFFIIKLLVLRFL